MRIISGSLKGKRIQYLKSLSTRPLKDSVKENLFNILNHSKDVNIKIEKSNILDLYSGIGSFGLECISRGAKKVTFVEKDDTALRILKKNLDTLSIKEEAEIIDKNIENISRNISGKKYKIFFLDPPFASQGFINVLIMIKNLKIFTKDHVVIIHREKKSKDNLENLIEIKRIKKYGRSKIIIGEFI